MRLYFYSLQRELILILFLFAAAAGPQGMAAEELDVEYKFLPINDENNKAHGAAWTADSMHFRKEIPHRPDWKPLKFYFKHCTEVGPRVHYSMTSYDCTGPY